MKKVGIFLYSFLILLTISVFLISCENFMKGSGLSKEIENLIEYKQSPEFEIDIGINSEYGTVRPYGAKSCKVSDKFKISFTENDNYKFLRWLVLDSDGAEIDDCLEIVEPYSFETQVKVNAAGQGLQIVPVVIGGEQRYSTAGISCDSPIVIKSSVPLKKETVENYVNVSLNTTNEKYTDNYNEFYYNPVLSVDGKSITIVPKGDEIQNVFGTDILKDIYVRISGGIKTASETDVFVNINNSIEILKMRINRSRIETIPNIIDFKIKSLSTDEYVSEAVYYDDGNGWINSDYEKNHVNKIFIECQAEDNVSGIYGLQVNETLIVTADGIPVPVENLKTYSTNGYCGFVKDSQNHNLYKTGINYDFYSLDDGIVKLTVQVYNYAGVPSLESKIIYVFKDTKVDPRIKVLNNDPLNPYVINFDFENDIGFISEDKSFRYEDECIVSKIEYGQDDICLSTEIIDGIISTYKLDESKLDKDRNTWIKFYTKDSLGNESITPYKTYMPKQGVLLNCVYDTNGLDDTRLYALSMDVPEDINGTVTYSVYCTDKNGVCDIQSGYAAGKLYFWKDMTFNYGNISISEVFGESPNFPADIYDPNNKYQCHYGFKYSENCKLYGPLGISINGAAVADSNYIQQDVGGNNKTSIDMNKYLGLEIDRTEVSLLDGLHHVKATVSGILGYYTYCDAKYEKMYIGISYDGQSLHGGGMNRYLSFSKNTVKGYRNNNIDSISLEINIPYNEGASKELHVILYDPDTQTVYEAKNTHMVQKLVPDNIIDKGPDYYMLGFNNGHGAFINRQEYGFSNQAYVPSFFDSDTGLLQDSSKYTPVKYWLIPIEKEIRYRNIADGYNYLKSINKGLNDYPSYNIMADLNSEKMTLPFFNNPEGPYHVFASVSDKAGNILTDCILSTNYKLDKLTYCNVEKVSDSKIAFNIENKQSEYLYDLSLYEYVKPDDKPGYWVPSDFDNTSKTYAKLKQKNENLTKFEYSFDSTKFYKYCLISMKNDLDKTLSEGDYLETTINTIELGMSCLIERKFTKPKYFYGNSQTPIVYTALTKVTADEYCIYSDGYSVTSTMYTNVDLGNSIDDWECYAGEVDIVGIEKNNATNYVVNKNHIPDGYYYCIITRFANGTSKMSEVYRK